LTKLSLLALAVLLVLGGPRNADASYRPVPKPTLTQALAKKPPKRGTRAKRAWAICKVWGRRNCRAALNVAWCESTLRPWARNGQYRGVFQMGRYERARFGHGRSVWAQARAAKRYYRIAGWRPWQCRP
jgi:hypothetical protein